MNWTRFLLILFGPVGVLGQQFTTAYFDRQGDECSPESSYCYCVSRKSRDIFSYDTVKFYYSRSNRLRAIGLGDQFGNRMGLHESYYENGTLKSRRLFEVNRNKKIDSSPDSIGCTILEFNDSLGRPMVQNGEGMVHGRLDFLAEHGKVVNGLRDSVWTVFYSNGKAYCYESWHLGKLIDGISFDLAGKEDYYQEVLVLPEPGGGFQVFYRKTSKKISYSKEAQRRSIEGKVMVEVLFEKEGSIAFSRIAKGIGFGCDEEALKAVTRASPWLPAKRRGQPINNRMTIPIAFKLK